MVTSSVDQNQAWTYTAGEEAFPRAVEKPGIGGLLTCMIAIETTSTDREIGVYVVKSTGDEVIVEPHDGTYDSIMGAMRLVGQRLRMMDRGAGNPQGCLSVDIQASAASGVMVFVMRVVADFPFRCDWALRSSVSTVVWKLPRVVVKTRSLGVASFEIQFSFAESTVQSYGVGYGYDISQMYPHYVAYSAQLTRADFIGVSNSFYAGAHVTTFRGDAGLLLIYGDSDDSLRAKFSPGSSAPAITLPASLEVVVLAPLPAIIPPIVVVPADDAGLRAMVADLKNDLAIIILALERAELSAVTRRELSYVNANVVIAGENAIAVADKTLTKLGEIPTRNQRWLELGAVALVRKL